MNRLLHRSSSALFVLLLSVTLSLSMPANDAEAGGGMGSVSSSNVMASSLTLSWGIPGNYKAEGANPYTICYKESGDVEGACSGGEVKHTANTSYPITGLVSGRNYKFKVICYCSKNNKHKKDRKVATTTIKTLGTGTALGIGSPPPAYGSVWATAVTSSSITLQWSDPNFPSSSDVYRICWKKAWGLQSLYLSCPSATGQLNTKDENTTTTTTTITGLNSGQYKIRVMCIGSCGGYIVGDLKVKVP